MLPVQLQVPCMAAFAEYSIPPDQVAIPFSVHLARCMAAVQKTNCIMPIIRDIKYGLYKQIWFIGKE